MIASATALDSASDDEPPRLRAFQGLEARLEAVSREEAFGPSISPAPLPAALVAVLLVVTFAAGGREGDSSEARSSRADRLRAAIRRSPGATAPELADEVGVHPNTVRDHLEGLRDRDGVVGERFGRAIRYFPDEWSPRERAVLDALERPTRARLVEALADADEPLRVAELAETARVSESTASEHLRKLAGNGVLVRREQGRAVLYRLADGVETVLRDVRQTD